MSSNLKVNNILPSTGDTVAVSGIASVTSSVSIASSCTATTFYGSGANLTGITGTTINSNANNRIITGSGTANTLNAESNFTYDGNEVAIYAQTDDTDCVLSIVGKTASGGVGQAGRTAIIAESSNNSNGQSKMHFRTRNTSNAQLIAMTIDGDQNVGIGTQSPQAAGLTVLKHSEARLQVWANGDGSNGKVALRADGVNTQMGTWSDHDIHLVRNSTIQATINSNGIAFPAGKGIDFSATGDSGNGTMGNELFDDYEEGSWTPAFNTANSSGTLASLSYDVQEGRYIKIGSTVYIEGALRTTNVSVPVNGTYDISGLPFTNTSGGSSGVHGIIHCGSQHSWNNAPNTFDPMGGTTYMRARGGINVGDSTYTNGYTNDFNSGSGSKNRVYFSGTYSTDF